MAKKKDIEKVESAPLQPLENIENLIQVIRGKQVILDRDLARLYGVETRRLNEQVRRNIERFPADFMFQLTKEEAELSRSQFATLNDEEENLKSQFATSSEDSSRSQFATLNDEPEKLTSQFAISSDEKILKSQIAISSWGGTRKLPYAFTENGIAMLSSVLRSPIAIATNIQIMRAFTAMRRFIAANAQVFQRLEVIEHTQLSLAAHQEEADKKFEEIFRRLDDGSVTQKQGIFYDGQIFDAYVFITERVREAKKRIVLIDNYIDESVFTILDKRPKGVKAKVYTKNLTPQLALDLEKHNAQYAPIEIEPFDRSHDRFLCIDDTVYHIGASLKDLGKKWFAFAKMELTTDDLLTKI
ncbi:MAG: ORF6N domain-containing protein [Paludibacteraceae bacterium]|nr:ORF6N domain-containing protein [Paludibacteraceae bacterium]